MKKNAVYFMASLLLIVTYSCSNDSEDDLVDQMEEEELITYTDDVKVIIDNNCNNCHSDPPTNGAPIALVTYTQVRNSTENGSLINRIQRQVGESGAMPLGGPRLPQNLIDIIVQWQTDGFFE